MRPAKAGGPRVPERRSSLSRPHERAGTEDSPRTPHERESGGSSPKDPGGSGRHGTWSSFLDLATDADGETIRSLPAQAGRATRLHRVHSADQRSVANPRGAGEMRVRDGTSTRPVRVPRRESGGQSGAPTPSPTLNLPAPSVRGISVYFSAASRPIELSLQSSFQLSLMVLVIYRSRA